MHTVVFLLSAIFFFVHLITESENWYCAQNGTFKCTCTYVHYPYCNFQKYADEKGIDLIETSAKFDINVEQAFVTIAAHAVKNKSLSKADEKKLDVLLTSQNTWTLYNKCGDVTKVMWIRIFCLSLQLVSIK